MAYAPAVNLTNTVGNFPAVWYNRKGLSQLKKKFRFLPLTEPDQIPQRNGKLVAWFRYTLMGANTTPTAEGVVGAALQVASTQVTATVSEYSDYVTFSTLLKETAIDPVAQSYAEQLSYRAGLSVDTITRLEFDSVASTATDVNTIGAYLSANDFRRVRALLTGSDVRPKQNDDFLAVAHPYCLYDLMADNTAGGFIDVTKYTRPDDALNAEEGKVGGCRIVASTNVATDTTAAPNTRYYCYVCGEGAVGSVDLAGSGPSRIVDPAVQAFKIATGAGGPNLADPEGKIGGFVSYRFVYVAKILDTATYRFRRIAADPSII